MKNSLDKRLGKIEKTVEKKNNPYFDKEIGILVNVGQGETPDQKFAEMEKELGCKINKKKATIICVSGLERI